MILMPAQANAMDEEDAEEDWVKEQIRKGVSSMATMNQTAPQNNPEHHSAYSQFNMAALPVQSEQASVATIALKGKNALDKLRQDFHRLQVDFYLKQEKIIKIIKIM